MNQNPNPLFLMEMIVKLERTYKQITEPDINIHQYAQLEIFKEQSLT